MNANGNIAVRFDRVSKSMGETRMLEDVSFDIPQGTALSILGRRGTGKTLALKLAIGLLRPDQGKIFLHDEEITTLDMQALLQIRKSTGFVFQNAAVFDSVSVAENIAFPLRCHSKLPENEIEDIVAERLLQVGLEQEGGRMPPDLSVGMRKLIGLARALACDPSILLLDDPWNGVDSITAATISRLLLDLKQRRHTTLMIANNKMAEVRHIADRFVVLDKGRTAFCGLPSEMESSDDPIVRQFVSPENF